MVGELLLLGRGRPLPHSEVRAGPKPVATAPAECRIDLLKIYRGKVSTILYSILANSVAATTACPSSSNARRGAGELVGPHQKTVAESESLAEGCARRRHGLQTQMASNEL